MQRHTCKAHINLLYILSVYTDMYLAIDKTILQQDTLIHLQCKTHE